MGRLERSWLIFKASMRVLNERRELVMFPVLSGVAALVVAVSFLVPGLLVGTHTPGGLLLLGLGYLAVAYVEIFFQVALVSQADVALDDGDPSVAGGLAAARRKAGAIVGWALVSATVSVILRAIEERAGVVGRILVAVVGLAWSLVTYLVVPILVFQNVGVGEAISRSASMFKRTWGENVAGNVGIGLVGAIAGLLGVGAIGLGTLIGGPVGVGLMGLGVVWVLAVAVVASALSGIFQTALYRYAASGSVAPAFGGVGLGEAFPPRREGLRWARRRA